MIIPRLTIHQLLKFMQLLPLKSDRFSLPFTSLPLTTPNLGPVHYSYFCILTTYSLPTFLSVMHSHFYQVPRSNETEPREFNSY